MYTTRFTPAATMCFAQLWQGNVGLDLCLADRDQAKQAIDREVEQEVGADGDEHRKRQRVAITDLGTRDDALERSVERAGEAHDELCLLYTSPSPRDS